MAAGGGSFHELAVVAHPKLPILGDIFATPRWFLAHDVFSIGDVLIVTAVALLVYRTCREASDVESHETGPTRPSCSPSLTVGSLHSDNPVSRNVDFAEASSCEPVEPLSPH
jgi:hypothetical protein